MPRTIDQSFRRISILWLISLTVIALLALSSDILINNTAVRSETFAELVDIADRQRTWTAQIALHAARLVSADTESAQTTHERRLRQTLETMRTEYRMIADETSDIDSVADMFGLEDGLDRLSADFWAATEALLELPINAEMALSSPYLAITSGSQVLDTQFEVLVRELISTNQRNKRTLQSINSLRILAVMVILIGQFAFAFRPAILRLRQRARDLEIEIAERKRIEAELRTSESRFRSLVETAPVGIFQSDLRGAVSWVNPRWMDLMGLAGDSALGTAWMDALHPDDRSRVVNAMLNSIDSDSLTLADYRIIRHGGEIMSLHATTTLTRTAEGAPAGLLGTIMDITQRKLAEERALKLEAERQRIRVLGEFIRDTSHDLRTPLAVIKSGLYFIRKLTDLERIRERAVQIDEHVNYLNVVIDQLQEMAVLDTLTDLTLMETQLAPLLRDVVAEMARKADRPTAEVRLSTPADLPPVLAAPDKLIQALRAVLDNARRYTPATGQIEVRAASDGTHVTVEIMDTGIGIAPENLNRVFDRFYKVDEARGVGGGAGLGLPIARRIVELHGGEVSLESALGKGTTVRISLNAARR